MRILFVLLVLALVGCSNREDIQIIDAKIIGGAPDINNQIHVSFNEEINRDMYVYFKVELKDGRSFLVEETGYTSGDNKSSFDAHLGSFTKKGSSNELHENLKQIYEGNIKTLTIYLKDSEGIVCEKTFRNL